MKGLLYPAPLHRSTLGKWSIITILALVPPSDTRFNDRFEAFDSRGGEGRIERLIRISREPIFYAKFSTRRFHRSRADNRLKYSERAREKGRGRKCAAPVDDTTTIRGRVKKRRGVRERKRRSRFNLEGGGGSYWWWCNQFAVRILLNPISRCQVNRDSFHWRGERVERVLLLLSSSLYLDPIHHPSRGCCPRGEENEERGSQAQTFFPSKPCTLFHLPLFVEKSGNGRRGRIGG